MRKQNRSIVPSHEASPSERKEPQATICIWIVWFCVVNWMWRNDLPKGRRSVSRQWGKRDFVGGPWMAHIPRTLWQTVANNGGKLNWQTKKDEWERNSSTHDVTKEEASFMVQKHAPHESRSRINENTDLPNLYFFPPCVLVLSHIVKKKVSCTCAVTRVHAVCLLRTLITWRLSLKLWRHSVIKLISCSRSWGLPFCDALPAAPRRRQAAQGSNGFVRRIDLRPVKCLVDETLLG